MLTQSESEYLLSLEKWLSDPRNVTLETGRNNTYDLESTDPSERFILDIYKGQLSLKVKYQTRARKTVVLVRVDLMGAPHTNPDGQKVECPHVHVYKEGFDSKWAYPLDPDSFSKPEDVQQLFIDFCRYCNIRTPNLESTLL